MVHLLQFALVVWLLVLSRRVVRNSLVANVLAIARWIASLAAGVGGGWLVCRLIWRSTNNFVVEILLAYAAGAAVFGLTSALLARRARRHAWSLRSASALGLPKWCDRVSNFVLLLILWLAALMALDLTTPPRFAASDSRDLDAQTVAPQLPAATPTPEGAPPPGGVAEDDATERVRSEMALQSAFFGRFRQGWEQSKEDFYRTIGAGELRDKIEAVQQITALPNEEKAWLLDQNPEIAGLIDHPSIRRIVRNEDLMAKFDRMHRGSLSAIYEIGENADVRRLLEDPHVLQIVRQVDPLALMQQVQRHRREIARGDGLPARRRR